MDSNRPITSKPVDEIEEIEEYGLHAETRGTSGQPSAVNPPTIVRGTAPPSQQQFTPGQQGYGLQSELGLGFNFGDAPSFGGAPEGWQPGMQQQPVGFVPPPVFTLEQLPPDQRVVQVTQVQANDLLEQLMMQSQYTGAPLPQMVDMDDAHKTFINSLDVESLAYFKTVESAAANARFPVNVRPSLLQTKLKAGQCRLQDLVRPVMEPGQQGFVDLSYAPDGALLEDGGRVWQFGLTMVKAEGVGPTGLRHARHPCLYVARAALFDRANNRFLGNVIGMRPEVVVNKDANWQFNLKERAVVRCNNVQPDPRTGTRLINDDTLSLYIELNTSYRLDIADTKHMPNSETKASRMVDEVCSSWAMVSFRKCCTVGRETEVSVPLYYGSLYDPQLLDVHYKTERKKQGTFATLLKPKKNPILVFRVGPLIGDPPPLLPYGFLPSTMMAMEDLGVALGAFRATLALQMARQHSAFAAVSDPVLSSFPGILADHHLLTEFLVKWRDATAKLTTAVNAGCMSPTILPPIAAVIEAFRRCVVEVSPLLHCASMPPKHINNFVEYQGHRLKLVQQFCHVIDPKTNTVVGGRHPVEPLSHAGFEFLHKPFDVSEVRMCMADRLSKGLTLLNY